jgi:UDP-glucose 4-epimerase
LLQPPPDSPVFCSGATGYIGGGILRALSAEAIPALGGLRKPVGLPEGVTPVLTGDLAEPGFNLPPVSAVVHAAGLGHRRGIGPQTWRRQNVDAAVNLARAARRAGAARFILISTAYIHGRTHAGTVTDSTPPNPMDIYAESKLEAEHEVAAAFGHGLIIIRPAAVIGPAAPGNIPRLLKLIRRGLPLPFAGIQNQRSFIHRADLAAIVLAALRAPYPPESILAAHPESISTPDLIRALADGAGVPARLFDCPPRLISLAASLLGRAPMWQSLSGNFTANPAAARALGWNPAETLAESMRQIARYHHTTDPNA